VNIIEIIVIKIHIAILDKNIAIFIFFLKYINKRHAIIEITITHIHAKITFSITINSFFIIGT